MPTVIDKNLRKNPCSGCPGYCCSDNLINLCGYDIWTIATTLHIKATDFVAFAELYEESPYNFKLDCSGKAYCLALYMKQLSDDRRRCIFALDLPNQQIRCGIYAIRPIACQAYPVAFFSHDILLKPWALCPEQSWEITQLDLEKWREELERHDMEFSIYAFIVKSWNEMAMNQPEQKKLDFLPFLNYLMDVYSRLEMARREMPAGVSPEIWHQWRRYTAKEINPLYLKRKETAGMTVYSWWLESIKEAVAESSQEFCLQAAEFEKYPEEIAL